MVMGRGSIIFCIVYGRAGGRCESTLVTLLADAVATQNTLSVLIPIRRNFIAKGKMNPYMVAVRLWAMHFQKYRTMVMCTTCCAYARALVVIFYVVELWLELFLPARRRQRIQWLVPVSSLVPVLNSLLRLCHLHVRWLAFYFW